MPLNYVISDSQVGSARNDAMVTVGFIGVCSIWAWEGGRSIHPLPSWPKTTNN